VLFSLGNNAFFVPLSGVLDTFRTTSCRAVPTLSKPSFLRLTTDQAKQLFAQLQPKVRYLDVLRRRIEQRHFPPDDELRQAVERACDAVQSLYMHVHYLSHESGVGRKRGG
jgi:hypothetical protein